MEKEQCLRTQKIGICLTARKAHPSHFHEHAQTKTVWDIAGLTYELNPRTLGS